MAVLCKCRQIHKEQKLIFWGLCFVNVDKYIMEQKLISWGLCFVNVDKYIMEQKSVFVTIIVQLINKKALKQGN